MLCSGPLDNLGLVLLFANKWQCFFVTSFRTVLTAWRLLFSYHEVG